VLRVRRGAHVVFLSSSSHMGQMRSAPCVKKKSQRRVLGSTSEEEKKRKMLASLKVDAGTVKV